MILEGLKSRPNLSQCSSYLQHFFLILPSPMAAPLTRNLPKDFLWGFATGMSLFLVHARRKERRGSDLWASVPSTPRCRNTNGIFPQLPFKLRGLRTLMDEESQYGTTLRRCQARRWTERMARQRQIRTAYGKKILLYQLIMASSPTASRYLGLGSYPSEDATIPSTPTGSNSTRNSSTGYLQTVSSHLWYALAFDEDLFEYAHMSTRLSIIGIFPKPFMTDTVAG